MPISGATTIVICGNRHQDNYLPKINDMIRLMLDAGISVYIERRFADYMASMTPDILQRCRITDTPPPHTHVAVSIGGDGTFLRTARWIGRGGIPVLGINTGHLGFLAGYTLDEAPSLIDMLLNHTGIIEERIVLQVESPDIPADILPFALNEVAILKEDTSSMISVHLTLNDFLLADYMADGLIISTPTGSTGYNLAVGGPILQPTLQALSIAPIAPHTLTLRPIIIGSNSVLHAVTTSRATHYRVSLDGCSFVMTVGTSLTVRRADFSIRTLRRSDTDFAATLRNKLLWGQR
ncbi:MAG: NAD(+)/NADH kinase [Muribaculaceae bacterium]|nr:NAD(+)/NADH kinase [Muribaculaceae bacterium]